MNHKVFIKTSKEQRVIDTTKEVISELQKNSIKIYGANEVAKNFQISKKLYPSFHLKLREIIEDLKNSGISESDYVKSFLKGERIIKPINIAIPYLKEIYKWFGVYDKKYKGKKLKRISFRHGEKGIDGNLTDTGIEQAKNLGKNINQEELDGFDYIHLLGTHNMLNESIIYTLFGTEMLKNYDLNPLGFTEKVIYEFYEKEGKSFLKVRFRNIDGLETSYESFLKKLSDLKIQL